MIEIVFSDSACGSLKVAQGFGKGPFPDGCTSVLFLHKDGSRPTRKERKAAQREAEEQQRREWEQGEPMDGNPADVYGLHLGLSIGDISEDIPGPLRQKALARLFSFYPGENVASELLQNAAAQLHEIQNRVSNGEDLRLWYSDQPDELCGLYWLLTQLPSQRGRIYLVKLPEWELREDGSLVRYTSWGDVKPGQWRRFLSRQTPAPAVFCRACAGIWRTLQAENAPLRAVLNGRLVSMPETLYDGFIAREIAAQEETFQEARLIGSILGKYQLGIGDAWIALRIEEMIRAGRLETVTEPLKDVPAYHRILRKTASNA